MNPLKYAPFLTLLSAATAFIVVSPLRDSGDVRGDEACLSSRQATAIAAAKLVDIGAPPAFRVAADDNASRVSAGGRTYFHRAIEIAAGRELARRVTGAGLVVEVDDDCDAAVSLVGIDRLKAAFQQTTPGRDRSERRLSGEVSLANDIGSGKQHVAVLGRTLDLGGVAPLEFDRVKTHDGAYYGLDSQTGLVVRNGGHGGHGAFVAPDGTRPASAGRADSFVRRPLNVPAEYDYVGSGNAYERDPLFGEPAVLPVPRLADGSALDGKYARVSSAVYDVAWQPTGASGPAGEFLYEPSRDVDQDCVSDPADCSLFDNVNTYVHLDRFAHDFWAGEMGVDIDFQTHIRTHTSRSESIAYGDTILFGTSSLFMRNNALEDEIIYHEYSHVVLRHLGFTPDIYSRTQHRALGEGYADYFALTYADQAEFANWATVCPPRFDCEGPENEEEIRTLEADADIWNWKYGRPSSDLKYGVCTRKNLEDEKCKTSWMTADNVYVWGMIWGSTLWDIRRALGREIADRLVLHSILLSGGNATGLTTAAGALLRADARLYGGAHDSVLRDIFEQRGIYPFLALDVEEAPGERAAGPTILSTYPNPAPHYVDVEFSLPEGSPAQFQVFDANGRRVAHGTWEVAERGVHTQRIPLERLAAGYYILRLESSGTFAERLIIRGQ